MRIATLQTDGDHPVVATVPDIFDTPLIQQEVTTLGLTTTQITADKSVIQEANAEITEFALAHGIPVIDLYAASDALLTAPLTLAGVNFTTSQLFAPDGFHPSAIEQGLLGNMVIDAVDLGYGTGLAPISDQQLVTDVGDTATVTGPTYFNLAPFILTPPSAAVASETITASISTPSTQSILVNLSFGETIPGQGEGVLTSGTSILIPAGQTKGTVTLTDAGALSAVVVVSVTSVDGAVEQAPQQVTTVLAAAPPVATLSESTSSFSASGGAGGTDTITVTLSQPTVSGAVIDLSFGGTATEGSDYTASSDSIYIPAGSQSGSITLTGNNNLLASASETIVVTMTSVTGAYGEVPQQVTATLNNISQTTGSISGTVVANTATGPGIPGVLVYIDENGNGTFEPVASGSIVADPFTYSNLSGAYSFSGLMPGSYTLLELVPTGITEISPAGGSITVSVTAGATATATPFVDTSNSITLIATDLSGHPLGSPTFNEDGGQIQIEAVLPAAATNNVVVNLKFTGTAVEGTDYAASGASIFIPAGQSMG